MPRTSVYIEDRLYRKLVEESVKRYGSTKHISKVLNEKLLLAEKLSKVQKKIVELPVVSIGKKLDWKIVEKTIEKETENLWKE